MQLLYLEDAKRENATAAILAAIVDNDTDNSSRKKKKRNVLLAATRDAAARETAKQRSCVTFDDFLASARLGEARVEAGKYHRHGLIDQETALPIDRIEEEIESSTNLLAKLKSQRDTLVQMSLSIANDSKSKSYVT